MSPSCLIEHILAQVGLQKILGLEELSASSGGCLEEIADTIPFLLSYLDLLFKPHLNVTPALV